MNTGVILFLALRNGSSTDRVNFSRVRRPLVVCDVIAVVLRMMLTNLRAGPADSVANLVFRTDDRKHGVSGVAPYNHDTLGRHHSCGHTG